MKNWKIVVCLVVVCVAGMIGIASAALCPKCSEMMFTCDIGKCTACGGDTSSGGFKLCSACSAKKAQCSACLAALKAAPPADKDAKAVKPVEPVATNSAAQPVKATVVDKK